MGVTISDVGQSQEKVGSDDLYFYRSGTKRLRGVQQAMRGMAAQLPTRTECANIWPSFSVLIRAAHCSVVTHALRASRNAHGPASIKAPALCLVLHHVTGSHAMRDARRR